MDLMFRRFLSFILLGAIVSGAPMIAEPPQNESAFPFSVWLQHKEVTQIPWVFSVGKPTFRSDLRRELRIGGWISLADLEKTGSTHDLVLFARVLERGKVVTPLHSVTSLEGSTELSVKRPDGKPYTRRNLTMVALASPGKYKVEVALLDRATGRYNTRFEDVSIDGDENQPLEQALRSTSKFEFVPMSTLDQRDEFPLGGPIVSLPVNFPTR
jgi:hypothetical protein